MKLIPLYDYTIGKHVTDLSEDIKGNVKML